MPIEGRGDLIFDPELRREAKLKAQIRELEDERGRDVLTGLFNRLFLKSKLEGLIKELDIKQQRANKHRAVIVVKFDLKGLKALNEKGHDVVGDKALCDFSELITKKVARRGNDLVFRVGGDEFTVILSIERQENENGLEEVIKNVLESTKEAVSGVAYMGYSILRKGESVGVDELLNNADKMLVENKAKEKNKVK